MTTYTHIDNVPVGTLPYVEQAASSMAAKLDAVFREALDKHCPGWTMDMVRDRCTRVSRVDWEFGHEQLCLDGVAIAEIFPLRTNLTQTATEHVMTITQDYRIF